MNRKVWDKQLNPVVESGRTAVAKSRYLRISAQKLNGVARLIRGRRLAEAERTLAFLTKKGAFLLLKTVRSAAANGVSKSLSREKLFVSRVEVGQGPTLKRGQPVSRGVFHPVLKKTAHVLVELKEVRNGAES